MKSAIVLLSGGLDSATVAAIAKDAGYAVHALSFDYGQRHRVELDAARRVAAAQAIHRHAVMTIDLRAFGGSALTSDIAVPKHDDLGHLDKGGVPVTYVPARNTIFLSFALAFAEVTAAEDIFIGVNALDYSGYPDCRPEFIHAFETLAHLATKAGSEDRRRLSIHAPLIAMNKSDIIRRGSELGVDFGLTLSCYDPDPEGLACGRCDSCLLRRKGFEEAGVPDPTRYWTGS
jgi:7-cyano-7-deazaguanine synthase